MNDPQPTIPVHSRQAAWAMFFLLLYSVAMFTLPFVAFYAVRTFLSDTFHITGFANTCWSVAAAVVTVNGVIMAYAYRAYHETEYDDDGNEIDQSLFVPPPPQKLDESVRSKELLNVKRD